MTFHEITRRLFATSAGPATAAALGGGVFKRSPKVTARDFVRQVVREWDCMPFFAVVFVDVFGLRRYDESSDCTTARQHEVIEVACCRLARTLVRCVRSIYPLRKGSYASTPSAS